MSDYDLPIKMVTVKESDKKANSPRGSIKFFSDFTPDVQAGIVSGFESVLSYYHSVFEESSYIPAVGKITMKDDAIAKSHKPVELCRYCPIIGGGDLNEIYIKVTREDLKRSIRMAEIPTSEKIKANMTAVKKIEPVKADSKIAKELSNLASSKAEFDKVKDHIKIKLFDFNNDNDNNQIAQYVHTKLDDLHLADKCTSVSFGKGMSYIKMQAASYEDIRMVAEINGVRSISFIGTCSFPETDEKILDLTSRLKNTDGPVSDVKIGIIDGGISENNPFLSKFVVDRDKYVPDDYINTSHGTFIASVIEFGDVLNSIPSSAVTKYHLVDVAAVPNGDPRAGRTDVVYEDELMEILTDVMEKYGSDVKLWNLSIGFPDQICRESVSDLGIFLDQLQDEYGVQFFISSGNTDYKTVREWPPQKGIGENDRIVAPADSVRAITVGSIALADSPDSIVKKNEPSPFSRRGPGPNYVVKPEFTDYGGNVSRNLGIKDLGIIGLSPDGKAVEAVGTSYSTPRVLKKMADIMTESEDRDPLLCKALLVHSANMESSLMGNDRTPDNMKYYGFGTPSSDIDKILHCSKNEATLVFRQPIISGTHLEMMNFPYPSSLIHDGRCFGEIWMTLAYNPVLDQNYSGEYCRSNIDVSLGIWKYDKNKIVFNGQVPMQKTWNERYERYLAENGFKWCPVKTYHRQINANGIQAGSGWKLRADLTVRNGVELSQQDFVLIVTIRDSDGNSDIYSEVVDSLRTNGYVTTNLRTRNIVRSRRNTR